MEETKKNTRKKIYITQRYVNNVPVVVVLSLQHFVNSVE